MDERGHHEPYHGRGLPILIWVLGVLAAVVVVAGMIAVTAHFAGN